MSNSLLTGTAAFGGWDTTPIQGISNNNNAANSKMKPYKSQPIQSQSNPFTSEPPQSAPDSAYVNPFADFAVSTQPEPPQTSNVMQSAGTNQSRVAPIQQSKISSPLAPLIENENQMNDVFDLLFDTNDNANGYVCKWWMYRVFCCLYICCRTAFSQIW